jgi:hypothetical protein
MKHDQFKELLHLSFYHELDARDRTVLEEHLRTCSECRSEGAELEKLDSLLVRSPRLDISDSLLDEARRELRVALRLEKSKRPFWAEWLESLSIFDSPGTRLAFGGIATLIVGFFAGYLVFMPSGLSDVRTTMPGLNQASAQRSEPRVSNFRLIRQAPDGEEVEFTFDMVTPVLMRGNLKDNAVQRVMAQALLSDQNPGARLMTVNALSDQVGTANPPDKEIKNALIQAMKKDANVGVRREALKAIQKFPVDSEVKDALLFVLKNESNPSMRIDVINYLEKPVLAHQLVDPDVLNGLKQSMQSDNNNYIRIRAKNVYEEVSQQ